MRNTIFLLALIVLISGCTSTSQSASVFSIVDFSASETEVVGGNDGVTIYLEAINNGGSKVDHALACLMGSNFEGDYTEGMWELDDISANTICKSDTDLMPPDHVNEIAGDTLDARWKLLSPCIPETLTRTDEFSVRLFYDYASKASASIWVFSENEKTSLEQKGETLPTTLEIKKTSGPVDISLTAQQPIIYAGTNQDFTLRITVTNTGSGTVFDKNSIDFDEEEMPDIDEETSLNILNVTIDAPSGLDVSMCEDELEDLELKRGKSAVVSCDIYVKEKVTTKKSYPLTIKADYGYYTDAKTSIVTSGKKNDDNC